MLVDQSCPTLCDPVNKSLEGSMGFSRQEYWSGLPFPSPEHLSNPGIKLESPALQAYSLLYELQEVLRSTDSFLVGYILLFSKLNYKTRRKKNIRDIKKIINK